LLEEVWPSVVEEGSLTTTIHALRRLLGERPGQHRYIVTVTGKGYRFVANVVTREPAAPAADATAPETPPATPDPAPPARHNGLIAVLASVLLMVVAAGWLLAQQEPEESTQAAAAPARENDKLTPLAAVAVLPFENQTGDPALDQPGTNLVRSLSMVLDEAPNLSVVAQRSADASANAGGDARAVARELGATHLIEFVASGDSRDIKVSAQIIDGGAGYQVWSKDFRPTRARFVSNNDDVMLAVASVVATNAGSTVFPDRDTATSSVDAYVEWLRGIKAITRLSDQDFIAAASHFDKSTQLDPDFSAAWLMLAAAHAQMMSFGFDRPDSFARFREASEHARAGQPDSRPAHFAYALIAVAHGGWLDAEKHYMVGEFAEAWRDPLSTNVYMQVGRLRDAERNFRRSHDLAPGDPLASLNLAIACSVAGKFPEAQAFAEEAVRGGVPEEIPLIHLVKANTAESAGRLAEAADHMMLTLGPASRAAGGDEAVHVYYEALGNPAARPRALDALKRLETTLDHNRYGTYQQRMLHIYWYTRLGALDEAYRLADDWVAQYRHSSLVGAPHLAPIWSPSMRDFRRDARFAKFATGLKLMDYWKENGPPDGCRLDGEQLRCD
jgi:TolB-like protein